MKKPAALALALLLAAATGAHAQDGKPDTDPAPEAKKPAAEPAKADEEVEAVRGVRYRIELKSGGVLDGVIRAKGVFERRVRGGGYEPADQNDPNGGVRIWFPSRQDGFIFMPLSAIDRLYRDITGEFWPPERELIERGYAGIELPGQAIDTPDFDMTLTWTVADMLGYLRTWSACKRYERERGHDPVDIIEEELVDAWGVDSREVRWPLTLLVSRTH